MTMKLWGNFMIKSIFSRSISATSSLRFIHSHEASFSLENIENSNHSHRAHVHNQCSHLGFGFDIDGVLLHESHPIPGASHALKLLQHFNIPFVLLTNGGGKPESIRAAELSIILNLPITEEILVQSHTPFKELVYGTPTQVALEDKTVLVVGGDGNKCRETALEYGFKKVVIPADILIENPTIWPFKELHSDFYSSIHQPLPLPVMINDLRNSLRIDAILVFNDPRDWALDTQVILDLLVSHRGYLGTRSHKNGQITLPNSGWQQDEQPALYFSNPDFFWATSHCMPRLGQGGFQAALEGIWKAVTKGAQLIQTTLGKPHGLAFEYAETALQNYRKRVLGSSSPALQQVWFVGDNQMTDIKGANSFKSRRGIRWESVLVKSGIHRENSILEHRPSMIALDVQEAVRNIIDIQLRREAM